MNGDFPYASAPKGEYRKQTTDVGTFPPNTFGLYDMHGNVYEWCEDVYNKNYQNAPRDRSAWLVSKNNDIKLLRSGPWYFYAKTCRAANRTINPRAFRDPIIGFRVVGVAVP